MAISFYDAARVEELLDYRGCIDAMRRAMTALSSGERPQPLRQIFTVGDNQMFGTMPGELAALSTFGAKLVSVFNDPDHPGHSRHQGVVVAYDGKTGAVTCVAAVLVGVPAVAAGRCEGVCTASALVVGVGVGAGFACVADGLGISTAGAHSVDG